VRKDILGREKTKASPIVHLKYKVLKDVKDPTQSTLLSNSVQENSLCKSEEKRSGF